MQGHGLASQPRQVGEYIGCEPRPIVKSSLPLREHRLFRMEMGRIVQ